MTASQKPTDRGKLMRIYLNDHLMGSVLGIELARRSLNNNRGTPLGTFLEELLRELREDRGSLEQVMVAVQAPTDRLKMLAGTVGEKVGRLKFNGRLTGYSDLSRLLELEGLYAGVDLKVRLWRCLQHLSASDPRLADFEFARLIDRASSQLAELERHRLDAAQRAFT